LKQNTRSLDIITIIVLIGLVQGVFLCLILMLQSNRNIITNLTLAILGVFIVNLIWCICYNLNLLERFWVMQGLETVSLFLFGPILLLYIKAQFLGTSFKLKRSDFYHFVLPILMLLLFHPLFFGTTFLAFINNYSSVLPESLSFYSMSNFVFQLLLWGIQVLIYAVLIFKFIRFGEHQNTNKINYSSDSKEAHLRWIKFLVFSFLIFTLTGVIDTLMNVFLNIDFQSYYLNICLLVILIFIISYISFINKDVITNPIKIFKPKATNLSNLDIETIGYNIQDAMDHKNIYKNSTLSLKEFAEHLAVSTHQLSEYLNKEKETSFNDFINSHRIKYAQQLMKDSKNDIYTLEGIADQSGFRSLATFHRNFKKHSGMSPKKWLDVQ